MRPNRTVDPPHSTPLVAAAGRLLRRGGVSLGAVTTILLQKLYI